MKKKILLCLLLVGFLLYSAPIVKAAAEKSCTLTCRDVCWKWEYYFTWYFGGSEEYGNCFENCSRECLGLPAE